MTAFNLSFPSLTAMNQLSTYAQQLQAGLAWQGVGGPVPVSHSYVHTLPGAGNELGTIGH